MLAMSMVLFANGMWEHKVIPKKVTDNCISLVVVTLHGHGEYLPLIFVPN